LIRGKQQHNINTYKHLNPKEPFLVWFGDAVLIMSIGRGAGVTSAKIEGAAAP
jgi:hypothetical protein